MDYQVVDIENWSRGKLFSHYMDYMRIVLSLTVEIDVTPLKKYSGKTGLGFYPLMIWAVSKVINSHDEFKFGWNEKGELIKWDFVSPSYTVFHKEDENFTKMLTEYSDDIFEFCKRVDKDRKEHENERAIVKNHPANFFDVSCLPWVKYKHFDMHVFDEGKFLAPVVTWGKYEEENGKLMMPLSMNINHAVADGFHLSRFFNEVQEIINSFNEKN
ncbi:MAG: chloramphenicol acetyltransferase [Oscillospiraceae bacterium]|nr:chloramphenicol acetyltransferase [Oscillospiraceae bacterium]